MLGREIVEQWNAESSFEVVPTALNDSDLPNAKLMDISDEQSIDRVIDECDPDVVVNAAAYTAVDRAEDERDQAFLLNAKAPELLARACKKHDALFVHVSTDYVFSGELERPYVETDVTGPKSVYGQSKLEGERRIEAVGGDWITTRIAWLYGASGPNFAETMISLADKNPELKVVDDQLGNPTWAGDVARQLRSLIEIDARGTFHATNAGETTWFGFARAVFDRCGLADFPLLPCSTDEFPRPAPRPRNSRLDNLALREAGCDIMRPWQDALDDYVAARPLSSGDQAS